MPLSKDRIRPWSQDARYWEYDGEPILLVGASDEDNIFNHPDDVVGGAGSSGQGGLEQHLDHMVEVGANYIRCTLSTRDLASAPEQVWAYGWDDEGNHIFDLTAWNTEYWNRLTNLLQMAYDRDIIVQIEMIDHIDYREDRGWWDPGHPHNPAHNVNYTETQTGVPERWDTHQSTQSNPFFYAPEPLRSETGTGLPLDDPATILAVHEALYTKILDETLPFPNVLYCLTNEHRMPSSYSDFWSDWIRAYADGVSGGTAVYIADLHDEWDITSAEHQHFYNTPSKFDFVDVSQNNHQQGQLHWDRIRAVLTTHIDDPPRPCNTIKTYYRPTQNSDPEGESTRRIWRNLIAGAAAVRYHRPGRDPGSGIGLNAESEASIRAVRQVDAVVPFMEIEADQTLLSDRSDDEAYCAAGPNGIIVYFTGQGSVTLDTTGISGEHYLRWMLIDTGEWADVQIIDGDQSSIALNTPGNSQWVAVLDPVDVEVDRRFLDSVDGSGGRLLPGISEVEDAALEVTRTRWRNDDGNEAEATWREAEGTPTTVEVGETVRLRTQIQATGDVGETSVEMRWRKKGTADPWEPVS